MTFVHGKDAGILVAEYNLGALTFNVLGAEVKVDTHDVTVYDGSDAIARQIGLRDGSVEAAGFLSIDPTDYDAVLQGYIQTADGQAITMHAYTPAEGSGCFLGAVRVAKLAHSTQVGGMIGVRLNVEGDDGFRWGRYATPLSAKTSNGNSSTLDRVNGLTDATTDGLVATIHCTAVDTLTSLDVDIEESANDADWSTLASFTQLTDVGSERIEVAKGTSIARYLRAAWTLVGTSATFAVAVTRK